MNETTTTNEEVAMSDDNTFRVWIGCLACYNAGNLVGFWIDADEAEDVTSPREAFGAHIRANESGHYPVAHDVEQHEEFWVMDTDNAPKGCDREMSPMEAQEIAGRIAWLDSHGFEVDAYAAYCDNMGESFTSDSTDAFEEAFAGEWPDREWYAQELAEDLGALPQDYSWPASYIDWERAANDLFISDYWSVDAPSGNIYVFRQI